jgi:hypothetical protein
MKPAKLSDHRTGLHPWGTVRDLEGIVQKW